MTNQFTKAEQQIINAIRAYIIQLPTSKTSKYKKYSIYTDNGEGPLQILWAKEIDYENTFKSKLFKHQIISSDQETNMPRFYFKAIPEWNGCSEDLKEMLRQYNPTIQVYNMTGGCIF
jgi:hypothetical protein